MSASAAASLINELKESFAAGPSNRTVLKATTVNTATGLVNYDLQIPSKNTYPVNTPLRKIIPRVAGNGDIATRWKVVTKIIGSGYDAMGYVPEGMRSGVMTLNSANKAALYTTIGEEGNLTFEAWSAAKGFEDEKARTTVRLLQKMWLKEENALLGGNMSMALGTPTAPTVTTASTGGTITAGTYSVQVVALTYEGWMNWQSNPSIVSGLAVQTTVTSPVGETFAVNGGTSAVSTATAGSAISGTGTIAASTPPVAGAVAYGWYCDNGSGAKTLQAVTTINSWKTTAQPTTTGQNATAITGDHSKNDGTTSGVVAMDGLMYATFASAAGVNTGAGGAYLPGAYVVDLATGTAGTGTTLTASGNGTIKEIDAALVSMWNLYQTSPTVIYVNAQQLQDITSKILTNASAPLLKYDVDPSNGYDGLVAGGVIKSYFNPYTQNGGMKIPIMIHPTLPPGTILLWCQELPPQYMDSEIGNVAEVKVRRDYYTIDWPQRTRLYETGVYCEETLAVYAPFALGIIKNIAAG